MIGWEDERLMKLIGTSARIQNVAYLSQHEEGNLPSSLLWHARYGHINYDSLKMMKKNCVFGLPTIICLGEESRIIWGYLGRYLT